MASKAAPNFHFIFPFSFSIHGLTFLLLSQFCSAMESDALKAVAALNHHKLNGKTIDVSIARSKSALPIFQAHQFASYPFLLALESIC